MLARYDVVVIGAGPAGEGAAMKLVKEGRRVAVIDQLGEVGGNCAHVGTIPSKALRQTVYNLMRFRRDPLLSRMADIRSLPLSQVLARAHKVIDIQVTTHHRFFERNDVDLYYGEARFEDDHTMSVLTSEGVSERIGFESAVIATGSRPYQPADIDFNHPRVFDSDKILKLDYPVRTG